MDIFYKMLEDLDGVIALPFLDCRMGLGVAGEVQKAVKSGKRTWLIAPAQEWDVVELERFVMNPLGSHFKIRPLTDEEMRDMCDHPGELKDNPPTCVVGHEETRLRTFIQYGGKMRPYSEAHKVKLPAPEDFYALDPKKK